MATFNKPPNNVLDVAVIVATGAALLVSRSADKVPDMKLELVFLAIVGLAFTLLASVSILISCAVIRAWHSYIQELIDEDMKQPPHCLEGFYLPRTQPDFFHSASVDIFCFGIVLVCGCSWLTVLIKYSCDFAQNGVVGGIIGAAFWGILLYTLWKFTSLTVAPRHKRFG